MPRKWKTKAGQRIYPKDMSLPHLQNIIAMLERKATENMDERSFPCFNGDMAQMYAEQEWFALQCVSPQIAASQLYPIYDDLITELNKRHGLYQKSQIPART